MTLPPQLSKEAPGGSVRRSALGQLRRRLWVATLGLAILAAASFAVLTASANTGSSHVGQALRENRRGASSVSSTSAEQKVRCVTGVGLGRRETPCKTPMRLVCHKAPGQTVLRRIPSTAYWTEAWHVDFSPYHQWGADGPLVKGGRLSIRTPRGARREEADVSLLAAPPGKDVLISARCS
jgi:hypothetical protein